MRAADEIYPPEGGGFNLTYGNKKIFLCLAFSLFVSSVMAGEFSWGYCTWGVATVKGDAKKDKKGKIVDYSLPWSGNAVDWCSNAKKYATTDSKEKKGAIVVFSGPSKAGHVGIVTSSGNMKSMNDLDGLGKWTSRAISGFPNKKAPLKPSCYIHYREDKI